MSGGIAILGLLVSLGILFVFGAGYWFARLTRRYEAIETQAVIESLHHERNEAIKKYSDLTDNIAAAILLRNKDGQITYCSPFTEVLTGYARSEIYASENDFFLTICHESDKERLFRSLKVSEIAGEPFQFHFQFYHKSGIRMWGETRTVPILDDEGEVTATLSVTIDVTASMRHQKQIEEKNRELKDFTYMVSHDLKAPIFTIKGMTTVIKEDFGEVLHPAGTEILDHIEKATHRLEQLVSAVLEYSRIGQRELTIVPVDLNQVMQEVLADHHHNIETLHASISIPDLPSVAGDLLSLSQVFSNLVGNSLKYCPTDRVPVITIAVEKLPLPHLVEIRVTDNGMGIPQDKLEEIFRPFSRLHGEEIEGTGIGLATVRKLLDKMGGQIKVESIVGESTTFIVTLREQD